MLKLGTIVKDNITGLSGMLTHAQMEMDKDLIMYYFQPRMLNKETGQPIKCMWLSPVRVVGGVEENDNGTGLFEYQEALGKEAEDIGTTYTGKIVAIQQHISGCVHATIQSGKLNTESGELTDALNTDVRRLKIKGWKLMTEEERKVDQKKKPSPVSIMVSRFPKM